MTEITATAERDAYIIRARAWAGFFDILYRSILRVLRERVLLRLLLPGCCLVFVQQLQEATPRFFCHPR